MSVHDNKILGDLFDIVILNEILRKELLILTSKYVVEFGDTFDYLRPIAYVDFYDFVRKSGSTGLNLTQFLLNLEVFIIKLYNIGEIEKSSIKNTKLKLLRQSFAHRKNFDILGGKERLVIFMGLAFDLDTLFVANMSEGVKESEHIEYPYAKYIDLLLSDTVENFKPRKDNVKQLRDLNANLISKLFPMADVAN